MPYRRKYRKRSFKRSRRGRRRRSGGSRTNRMSRVLMRGNSYMPDKLLNRHKWVAQTTLTYTASSNNSIDIVANGLFEPNANVTHPVSGFAEMAGIYQLYNVLGCRIRVTVSNPDADPLMVSIFPFKDTLPANLTADDLAANPYSVWKTLAPAGSGGDTKTLSMYMSSKKMFGQRYGQTNNFFGTVSANPAEIWQYNIRGTFATDQTITLHLTIELDFYSQWVQRQVIDQDAPA